MGTRLGGLLLRNRGKRVIENQVKLQSNREWEKKSKRESWGGSDKQTQSGV